MRTTRAPPNILIRANIYNNDPIRYIVLVVSCFVLPIPNIYRDTSVLIPVLTFDQRCGFLVPLAFLLRPWTRLEGTSSNRAYLIYNSVDSLVRANTRARFCSSIKSMRHSLCL